MVDALTSTAFDRSSMSRAPAPVDRAPDARPRVVHVIPTFRTGGLEGVVARIAAELAGELEHIVVTPVGDGPVRARFPSGVRMIAMGDAHPPDRWNAIRMARLFKALSPDVVHSRNWTCIDAVIGARLAGVPVRLHGEHGRDAADPQGRNGTRRRVRRLLAPLVTRFVTVTDDLARWLVRDCGIARGKVTRIYNGVDTERFRPRQAGDGGPAPRGVVVGTVGRLDPVKNHVGLIRAFVAAASGQPAELVLVGDGPTRGELEELVRSLRAEGQVRLLGERGDVAELLRGFDLFAMSSFGEGMSNSVLEAMATGLPVLATRVGGNPELVVDGVTGALVEAGRDDALSEGLRPYLADPDLRRRHGAMGRARAEGEFSLAAMFGGYRALYRQALGSLAR